jgi:uncharacterized protein (TIGR02284 family)
MTERSDRLASLHTTLIDSRNGYDEALDDAEGKGLTPLFKEMIALRDKDIPEIAALLAAEGVEPDSSGSLMSTVHRAVISIRSLFSDLDETILPGLIDGEERVLKSYDEAIAAAGSGQAGLATLKRQRDRLAAKIAEMRRMRLKADRAEAVKRAS